jgi:hypothetical protein
MQEDRLWLHGVIHASYFMNWRSYIASYENQLLPIVSVVKDQGITLMLTVVG